jgi:Ran-binding protein 9/10
LVLALSRSSLTYILQLKFIRYYFLGPNNSYWESAGCVRANFPVPRALGLFYFEVTIIKYGPNSEEIYRSVGVGLGQKNVPLQNMPGWRNGSYGYHGDDGKFFWHGLSHLYGETFTTNNVIGCGVNFVKMELFYTKNGQYIGKSRVFVHLICCLS